MKLLYITNGINGSGGLERVLAVKASSLANNFSYEVHILTLNNGDINPFYEFSPAINYHDIKVGGNPINYILSYLKGIKNVLSTINPDVISVCDDGLKGMLFPMLFGKKIPVLYERHVSKQIEVRSEHLSVLDRLKSSIKFTLMNVGGRRFHKFVVLTKGNAKEWNFKNLQVLPNPLPFYNDEQSDHSNKKVIVVGKQSYQKGYDRLLNIWKLVHKKHPDWQVNIYGKLEPALGLEQLAKDAGLENVVRFLPPIKDIQSKYKEAAIYAMTSRFEGFGMVLIEAMAYGVPCISFDCPHGPADIINHETDGLLIENGNIEGFATALIRLIENKEERMQMGTLAKQQVQRFSALEIVKQWDTLFKSMIAP